MEEEVGKNRHQQMMMVEGVLEGEEEANHHLWAMEVVELMVDHTNLWVVQEEVVVVMEGNHKGLGVPMVEMGVVQSHHNNPAVVGEGMGHQNVPLVEVLPFFASEVQDEKQTKSLENNQQ